MSRTLINTTTLPVDVFDDGKRYTIAPNNSYTVQDDGIAARMLANASIAGFRFADSRDGKVVPTT